MNTILQALSEPSPWMWWAVGYFGVFRGHNT